MFDKILFCSLLSVSYGQLGFFQAFAGFFTYIVIMTENGFFPIDLYGLRKEWDSPAVNDLKDSYGQEWVNSKYTKQSIMLTLTQYKC